MLNHKQQFGKHLFPSSGELKVNTNKASGFLVPVRAYRVFSPVARADMGSPLSQLRLVPGGTFPVQACVQPSIIHTYLLTYSMVESPS